MSLTLLTYNILTGANGGRLDDVCAVVAAAVPDVVAVQELRGDPPLGTRTGMRLHVAPPRTGQPVGLLVAPHLRILRQGTVPGPFHHGAAWVELDCDGGPLTVISTTCSRIGVLSAGTRQPGSRRSRPGGSGSC